MDFMVSSGLVGSACKPPCRNMWQQGSQNRFRCWKIYKQYKWENYLWRCWANRSRNQLLIIIAYPGTEHPHAAHTEGGDLNRERLLYHSKQLNVKGQCHEINKELVLTEVSKRYLSTKNGGHLHVWHVSKNFIKTLRFYCCCSFFPFVGKTATRKCEVQKNQCCRSGSTWICI